MKSAFDLQKAMPHSKLIVVPDAGHSMAEVGIAHELVKTTD
jgi:proline iminopeptidase